MLWHVHNTVYSSLVLASSCDTKLTRKLKFTNNMSNIIYNKLHVIIFSDISKDFDIIFSSSVPCVDDQTFIPFQSASTSAISLSVWVRLTHLNQPASIVTLYWGYTR